MTDVQDIKYCALMGMVPEEEISKDYIINTALPQFHKWVTKGKVLGLNPNGSIKYGKQAPEAVIKRFQEDCSQLEIEFNSSPQYNQLGQDLATYMNLPKNSENVVIQHLMEALQQPTNGKDKRDSERFRLMNLRKGISPQALVYPASEGHYNAGISLVDLMTGLNSAFLGFSHCICF